MAGTAAGCGWCRAALSPKTSYRVVELAKATLREDGDLLGVDVGIAKLLTTGDGAILGDDFRAVRDRVRRRAAPGASAGTASSAIIYQLRRYEAAVRLAAGHRYRTRNVLARIIAALGRVQSARRKGP
jgi:hypothetical protein